MSWYVVDSAIFAETCASLLEEERNARFLALATDVENPIVVTHARIVARLSADGYLFAPARKFSTKIDRLEQRLTNYRFVTDWQRVEQRQSLVYTALIFHCAADSYIFISIVPIVGQGLENPLRTLRHNEEAKVAAKPHHLPRLIAPFVCLFDKEIGCEARPHQRSGRNLPFALPRSSYGQIEQRRTAHLVGIFVELGIATINVAMLAALALFVASVPQVPHNAVHHFLRSKC